MSDRYWQRAWSLIDGCSPVSEGCEHCWSAALVKRFKRDHSENGWQHLSLVDPKGHFDGTVRIRKDRLDIPLRTKKPTVWSIWNDLLHPKVSDDFIARALQIMWDCPQHTFLILTKRAERIPSLKVIPMRNVFWGVTAESQQRADERIPYILQVPGKRFLSLEPLLSEIDLSQWTSLFLHGFNHPLTSFDACIAGAETGPGHRPCKLEWIESIVQQCKDANIPCFVKAININGKVIRDIEKFPESLRVRNLPWK